MKTDQDSKPVVPAPAVTASSGVTFHYGGIDYDATVTKRHNDECLDLEIRGVDGATMTREMVMVAADGGDPNGRWFTTAKKARK